MEWKTCGKKNCKCNRGALHGPYYYFHTRDQGQQRKRYVKRRDVVPILIEIEHQRSEFSSLHSINTTLKQLSRMKEL